MMNFQTIRQAIPQGWLNWKTWLPLAVAAVLGLVAAKVAYDLTQVRPVAEVAPPVERLPVVFAARDVPAGHRLAAGDLAGRAVEAGDAPAGRFASTAELEGRVVRAPLFAGQAVVEGQLAPDGTGAGLQARIPAGMRAVTIEIDEFRGVAGFLVPGCFVDLVTTLDAESGTFGHGRVTEATDGTKHADFSVAVGDVDTDVARTVVQNLEVLAVGRSVDEAAPAPAVEDAPPMAAAPAASDAARSVTLLATPEQAEAVELACRKGQPRLVLRSSGDGEVAEREGVTLAKLRAGLGAPGEAAGDDVAYADAGRAADPTPDPIVTVADVSPAPAPAPAVRSERLVEFIRRGVTEATPVPLRDAAPPVAGADPHAPFADLPAVFADAPTDSVFPQ